MDKSVDKSKKCVKISDFHTGAFGATRWHGLSRTYTTATTGAGHTFSTTTTATTGAEKKKKKKKRNFLNENDYHSHLKIMDQRIQRKMIIEFKEKFLNEKSEFVWMNLAAESSQKKKPTQIHNEFEWAKNCYLEDKQFFKSSDYSNVQH